MPISASVLRQNIDKLLDGVLETGQPLVLERKGHRLKVVCDEGPAAKLVRLVKRDCLVGDPESLVHVDWSGEGNHDLP